MITIGKAIVPDSGITEVNGPNDWCAFVILGDEHRGLVVDAFAKGDTVTVRQVKYKIYGHSNTNDGKLAVYLTKKGV